MKRSVAISAGLGVVGLAAVACWLLRETGPPIGATPIALGETVQQILPGPAGESEVWTLSKREVGREELNAARLPQADLRRPDRDAGSESARALDALALEAWKTGRLREALSLFEAAIAADPDDWLPRADYGRLLVMMADYAAAGPHLERAAELNPDSARVWLDLYSHYQSSLQLERGLLAYERAEGLAGGRAIVQDETGLWRLDGDSIHP